jgi:hypothetical protein
VKLFAALIVALASALASPQVHSQELGRLFFTPDQRTALDERRRARVPDKPAATPQVESPITRVNGAVQRGGGKSTVWVNGEAIAEGAPSEARIASSKGSPGNVSLPAGEGGRRYDLRVGESLDRGSGEVRDILGDGRVQVGPRPAGPAKK